jgi:hypothetical protein
MEINKLYYTIIRLKWLFFKPNKYGRVVRSYFYLFYVLYYLCATKTRLYYSTVAI